MTSLLCCHFNGLLLVVSTSQNWRWNCLWRSNSNKTLIKHHPQCMDVTDKTINRRQLLYCYSIYCSSIYCSSIVSPKLFILPLVLSCWYTQRNLFKILLNQTEIRLYLPCSDLFGTANKNGKYNLISVWCCDACLNCSSLQKRSG